MPVAAHRDAEHSPVHALGRRLADTFGGNAQQVANWAEF